LNADGKLHSYKSPGRLLFRRQSFDLLKGAVAVIGHARYRTHGHEFDNVNNHPHAFHNGFLVHNGVVQDHVKIAKSFDLQMRSNCDSEVLARLIDKFPGQRDDRIANAVSYAVRPCAVMTIWKNPTALYVARAGNPLHFLNAGPGGLFVASLSASLPETEDTPALPFHDWQVTILEINQNVRITNPEKTPFETVGCPSGPRRNGQTQKTGQKNPFPKRVRHGKNHDSLFPE
jgi:glucosamine 6-phosphate synthetase-like amidotransferase/phosphosugar isomerase protein